MWRLLQCKNSVPATYDEKTSINSAYRARVCFTRIFKIGIMETNKTVKRFNQFTAARRKVNRMQRNVPELDMNQASGKQFIQERFIKDCIAYTTGEVQPYEGPVPEDTADRDDVEVQEADEGPKRKRLKLHVLNNCRGLYENSVLARRAKIVRPTSWSPEDNARINEDIQALAKIGPVSESSFKIVQPDQRQKENPKEENAGDVEDNEGKVTADDRQDQSDCRQILTSVIDLDGPDEANFDEPETGFQDPAQLINPGQPDRGKKSPAAFSPGAISKSNEPRGRGIADKNDDSPPLDRRRSRRHCIDDDGRMDIEMNPGPSGKGPAQIEGVFVAETNSDEEVALFMKRMKRSRVYHPRRAKDGVNTSQNEIQPAVEHFDVFTFHTPQDEGPEAPRMFTDEEARNRDVPEGDHPFFDIVGSGNRENQREVDAKNCRGAHGSNQEVEASQGGFETRQLFDRSPGRVEDDEIRQENGAGLEERRIFNAFLGPADQDRSYQEPCNQFTKHSRVGETESLILETPAPPVQRDPIVNAVQASRRIQEPSRKSRVQKHLDHFVDAQEVEASQGGLETRELFDRSPRRVEDDEIRQENGAGLEEWQISNAFLGPADQDRSYQEPCNQFTKHSRVGERDSLILEMPAPLAQATQASRGIQEPPRKPRAKKQLDLFGEAQDRSYQEPSHQFTENSNMGERDSPHFEMPATLAQATQASRGIQVPPRKSTAQKYLDPFGEPRASRAADSQLFSSLDAYAGGRNRFSPKSSQIYSRSNHEENGLSEPRNRQDALESRRLSKAIQDSRVEMQDSLPRPLQEIRRSSFLDCLEADEQIRSVAPAMQGMADIPCSRAVVPSDARVLRSFGYLLARFAGELGISQTTARPSQEMNTGKFFDSPREENHEPMMNITENRGDHNKNQKLARKSAENFHPERQPVSINDREGRNSEFSNQNVRTGNPSDIFAGTSLTSRGLQRSRSASRAPRIKGFADPDDIYRKLDSRGSDPFETFQAQSFEARGNGRNSRPSMRMRRFSSSAQDLTFGNIYRQRNRPPSPCYY
ncbi:Hypothetical protein NTJ_15540 [Nesidiocoris tenuis]|uniref:Uncharacterized protein n=1 Tax=Nesidiocoris tenuis TaxID=355587 RepID=A0ABN7BGB7_9HEMI|nr:Hypothetical protein NTJ_15540 [Nesidiocoris tenuis]